jgi:hypothetical protein
MAQLAECPTCSTVNEFADDAVGRYAACRKCGSRFWVVVPPLETSHTAARPNPDNIVLSRPQQPAGAAPRTIDWGRALFWAYFAALNAWAGVQLVRWLLGRN